MNRTARVYIDAISCSATTEAGEDEVYIAVGTDDGLGNRDTALLPSQDGHWNINDSGDRSFVWIRMPLMTRVVTDGASVGLSLAVLEQDGGTIESRTRVAAAIAAATAPFAGPAAPVVLAAGGVVGALGEIAGLLGISDTDDYLGSAYLVVTNAAVGPTQEWTPGEHSRLVPRDEVEQQIRSLENTKAPFTHRAFQALADHLKTMLPLFGQTKNDQVAAIHMTGDGGNYILYFRLQWT